MENRDEIVKVKDVTKRYGEVTALDGLSLSVEEGTAYGLLGTNGAGKTTLFKLLVGHTRPNSGSVEIMGKDVGSEGKNIRRFVGYLPQNAGFHPLLTGREVLLYHASMRGIPKAERRDRVEEVLGIVGLADDADRRVGGYSGGMNLRLGLATALLPRPEILLLDEPTAGLDPLGVSNFHGIIENLRRDIVSTVLISSHVISEVENLCDSVAILHEGRLRAERTVDELEKQCSCDNAEDGLERLFNQVIMEARTTSNGGTRE